MTVNSQWRVCEGFLIGLDYCALDVAARALDMELCEGTMRAIGKLEAYTLENQKAVKDRDKSGVKNKDG